MDSLQTEELYNAEHTYKEFVYRLHKMYYDEAHIILDDPSPELCKYITLLLNVSLKEAGYIEYYGITESIVKSFMNFYETFMRNTNKMVDLYGLGITQTELKVLITNTINVHDDIQRNFLKIFESFKPPKETEQPEEPLIDEETLKMRENTIQKLTKTIAQLGDIRKEEEIDKFAQDLFEVSLRKINDYFNFGHIYISIILADRYKTIHTSLDEKVRHINRNVKKFFAAYEDHLHDGLMELYDLQKESLLLSRKSRMNSQDNAEVSQMIEMMRKNRLECAKKDHVIKRLAEEQSYWENRQKQLNEIGSVMADINHELHLVDEEVKKATGIKPIQGFPGFSQPSECLATLPKYLYQRRTELKTKLVENSRCLVTFFGVRGADQILYTDSIGDFYIDEYGHRVYPMNFNLKLLHINSAGNYMHVSEDEPYYFDRVGRYINKEGEKIYQIAPCTSQYKMNEYKQFKKFAADCELGQEVIPECNCSTVIEDQIEEKPEEGLALIKKPDIKISDDKELANYIWNLFAWVLPEVMMEVEDERSKIPLNVLAHKLLIQTYRNNMNEIQDKRKGLSTYCEAINEKLTAEARKKAVIWRSKLVKRRKPEESDDTQEKMALINHEKGQQFIKDLDFYYI